MKLNNNSVTSKMVKKVIMNLDLSKVSGSDCILVLVLRNCEPELSYILAELSNKCHMESCFPDCRKVSSVVHVFKNVGEVSTAKNYCPVSLLSVVSKVFEKLVNNRIVDHLGKCGLFSDFQYGFRSLSNPSQKPQFFAVLMYSLYSHPRCFKFKQKYQQ